MGQELSTNDLVREERFWDEVGEKWLGSWNEADLMVRDASRFLSGSTVAFDYLMAKLGKVTDSKILDYGCGSGWLGTYLAQRGGIVYGFDISTKLVQLGMKRAQVNGVSDRVVLRKMIAEELDYQDGQFDIVVGISILHHIDLKRGGLELHRVLKPGGRALFIEPLGESSLQNWIRNYILRRHHGSTREVDAEHPLTYQDIQLIGSPFGRVEVREFQLIEMIARLTGDNITRLLGLRTLDQWLLSSFPALRRYCRLVVITYTK